MGTNFGAYGTLECGPSLPFSTSTGELSFLVPSGALSTHEKERSTWTLRELNSGQP